MMKIGLVGFGVVGKAAYATFSKNFEVIRYDKYMDLDKFEKLLDCTHVMVVVPTPFDVQKNLVDDSAILETLEKLNKLSYKNSVLIKSTVPPGSCDNYSEKFDLNIVFNPEFLRESTTPNEDFAGQEIVVIGTDIKENYINVKNMYKEVLLETASYYHTSMKEAEMIKCAQNTMLAGRVALANMIYDACDENQVNYDLIKEIAFDNFEILGPYMAQVPGPDGERGFGGKCLPKDIRAFSTIYDSELLSSIINYNDNLRDDLDNFLVNFKK